MDKQNYEMSLELVLHEKTIKNRHLLLSSYLKNNNVGVLSENEGEFFKHIFENFNESYPSSLYFSSPSSPSSHPPHRYPLLDLLDHSFYPLLDLHS